MRQIVFAGGCFWGVEAYFSGINGVIETTVGYANGNVKNPTYEMVCKNNTGFAEACYVKYDEKIISLKQLLNYYWKIIDPTVENRQGNDVGSQYRTGIYYIDKCDRIPILQSLKDEQKKYNSPIKTEVKLLQNFYKAEDYHQKYLKKNPNGYCHIPKELIKNRKDDM